MAFSYERPNSPLSENLSLMELENCSRWMTEGLYNHEPSSCDLVSSIGEGTRFQEKTVHTPHMCIDKVFLRDHAFRGPLAHVEASKP